MSVGINVFHCLIAATGRAIGFSEEHRKDGRLPLRAEIAFNGKERDPQPPTG